MSCGYGEDSQNVKILTAGQTSTIFSPTPLSSRAPAPIPRSFLSFPQIAKFSPLLSSKCLRANTSVPTEKGKRSPCGATVPTPPPLFLSPRPERTEDRTLGRACRIPIGREGLFLIRDLDCKIPVEDAPVVDLSGLMRVGCRSGYYRQYRWLALKKQRPCLDLPYYSVLVEEGTLLSGLNCISRLAALDFIWKWCIEGLATNIRLPLDKCCY